MNEPNLVFVEQDDLLVGLFKKEMAEVTDEEDGLFGVNVVVYILRDLLNSTKGGFTSLKVFVSANGQVLKTDCFV